MPLKRKKSTGGEIRCWLCHRFSEPSTYAGLAAPLMAYAMAVKDDAKANLALAVGTVCSLLAVILRGEKR